MWISTAPALGDYIPVAPTNDEAKQHNSKLPGMGGVFNHINLNCYHYAGNNPVRYTDPTGEFDIQDLASSFTDAFEKREHKYARFYDYNIERFITFEEYNYYTETRGALPPDKKTFYRQKSRGFEYCIAFKTEFGKMSKAQKITAITQEYQKTLKFFEEFTEDYFSTVKDLAYGAGESLFNFAQNGSLADCFQDFILNNFETIGDLGQVDLDGINILLDLKFLERRLNEIENQE
nr:hypothetical protein [Treponema zioleckii]